jgi:hypothetical protein
MRILTVPLFLLSLGCAFALAHPKGASLEEKGKAWGLSADTTESLRDDCERKRQREACELLEVIRNPPAARLTPAEMAKRSGKMPEKGVREMQDDCTKTRSVLSCIAILSWHRPEAQIRNPAPLRPSEPSYVSRQREQCDDGDKTSCGLLAINGRLEKDDPRLALKQQCAQEVAKACTELLMGTKP